MNQEQESKNSKPKQNPPTAKSIGKILINDFNREMSAFLKDMMKVMPMHKGKIKRLYNKLTASVITGHKTLALFEFHSLAHPFKDKIMSKQFEEAKSFVRDHSSEFELLKGVDLVSMWSKLDIETCDAIVSKCRLLFEIADVYMNKGRLADLVRSEQEKNEVFTSVGINTADIEAATHRIMSGNTNKELEHNMKRAAGVVEEFARVHGRQPSGAADFKLLIGMSRDMRKNKPSL